MDHENCHTLLRLLSDYVDGDLGPTFCDEIERHMAGCENCRIVVDTLQKTVTLYQTTAGPVAVPEDVRERLYSHLNLDEFLEK